MSKHDLAALAALAIAKGAKVTKVETGASAGYTARDFYDLSRMTREERDFKRVQESEMRVENARDVSMLRGSREAVSEL